MGPGLETFFILETAIKHTNTVFSVCINHLNLYNLNASNKLLFTD